MIKRAIILAVMMLPALAWTWGQPPAATGSAQAPADILRITAPTAGQKVAQTFVTLRWELTNPGAAAGTPNFQVRLDNRDPVTTTDTQQDLTGLSPGTHTVTILLVDANGTPVMGAVARVNFVTIDPQSSPKTNPTPSQSPPGRDVRGGSDPSDRGALPGASSPLPLFTVLGFGALLGGITSALKTR